MSDNKSREKIISEINTNFFVEAGAGSGKTTMLVNRMVAMVENDIPIKKICAITFTKAAASEFYERFQNLLRKRSNPEEKWENINQPGQLPKPNDETREKCKKALNNIDLCFMGTIDSFCNMVLSEHPYEASILSDSNVISDSDAEVLYRQQYVKICSGDYGNELAEMAEGFRRLFWDDDQAFAKGMSVLMNNRNAHFNYLVVSKAEDIDSYFTSYRDKILKVLKVLIEVDDKLKDTENGDSKKAWDKLNDSYSVINSRWSSNFAGVIKALSDIKKLRLYPEAENEYGDSLNDLFVSAGKQKGKIRLVTIDNEDGGWSLKLEEYRYSLAMSFLEKCQPIIEKEMHAKGFMSYFDYLYYLRNMLAADAERGGVLIKHIYDRHSYFLIDEFQDTNPLQAEIFFYLTSEHPVPKWTDCIPRKGSLFIVGDPKQSIYRFRGADVTSFINVKKLFEKNGDTVASLLSNYRSTWKICEYFNNCFSVMLPNETEIQSKFEEIPQHAETKDEFQGVYKYLAYTGKLVDDHPEETDPKQIVKIINTIVGRDEYRIRTKKDKEPRRIRYSDIMVITISKKKLRPIIELLDQNGISSKVEGDVPFGNNEALKEVSKIYSAVVDSNDAISLYGALTGKIIGLTEKEMLTYKANKGIIALWSKFDIEESKNKTACKVANKISELKKLSDEAICLSPAALFSKIMEDYKIYESCIAENIEILYYALELLRDAEKSGMVVSLKDAACYIRKIIEGGSGEERCLSLNEKKDAVRLANLHKVKGLEAPIVILAEASNKNSPNDLRVVHKDEKTEAYLFEVAIKDEQGGSKGHFLKTKSLKSEEDDEKKASEAEGLRLVYVAATRARNVLIICDRLQAKKGGGETHSSKWKPLLTDEVSDFFNAFKSRGKEATEKVNRNTKILYDETTCILDNRNCENATYSIENPSRLKLSSKASGNHDVATLDRNSVHDVPGLLGTMTHKLMEMLVSSKNMIDIDSAVSEIIREYSTPQIENKGYIPQLKKALSDVGNCMRNGGYPQNNGLPQDMLQVLLDADEVHCEVPLCYTEGVESDKIIWNGIMDVVYCSQGKWHIVDYKTNAEGSDLDTKYQAQLSAYIKAFKTITGNDADAKTYHIDI